MLRYQLSAINHRFGHKIGQMLRPKSAKEREKIGKQIKFIITFGEMLWRKPNIITFRREESLLLWFTWIVAILYSVYFRESQMCSAYTLTLFYRSLLEIAGSFSRRERMVREWDKMSRNHNIGLRIANKNIRTKEWYLCCQYRKVESKLKIYSWNRVQRVPNMLGCVVMFVYFSVKSENERKVWSSRSENPRLAWVGFC